MIVSVVEKTSRTTINARMGYATHECSLSLAPGLRNKRFDVGDAARQRRGHPLDAFRSNQHVVFDADADAFVFFEGRLYRRDEFFALGVLRQIIQSVNADIDAG